MAMICPSLFRRKIPFLIQTPSRTDQLSLCFTHALYTSHIPVQSRSNQRLHLTQIADIGGTGLCLPALGADIGGNGFGCGLINIAQRHPRAARRDLVRDKPAKAAASACNYD